MTLKVAINGIGIGGPTLAYWLRRFGHEPTLFDNAPALRTGGYVIDFWGLGYEIAERMGVAAALREHSYDFMRMSMVDERGQEEAAMDVAPVRAQMKGRFVSIARADLASVLFRACEGVTARFAVSIDGIEQDKDGVLAVLTNGQRERFDLIVGADGLHSRVRTLAFGPEVEFEKPIGCYVAAFRLHDYPHRDELTYVSHTVPKRHVSRVALRGGKTLVLFVWLAELTQHEPEPGQQKDAVRRTFAGMEWEIPEMLARIDDAHEFFFDRVSQIRLPRWSVGRVALIGDAAACVSLLAGEGSGLAMLEAYVLAGELKRAGGDIDRGFVEYEATLSRPFIARQMARGMGDRLTLPEYE